MEYGNVATVWVDDDWGAVSIREDLDGSQNVVFTPDRQIKNENDGDAPAAEIVMNLDQAVKVARGLRRAVRRAKVT